LPIMIKFDQHLLSCFHTHQASKYGYHMLWLDVMWLQVTA
jgi:hypothetical protein